jgi:hypothetical protein
MPSNPAQPRQRDLRGRNQPAESRPSGRVHPQVVEFMRELGNRTSRRLARIRKPHVAPARRGTRRRSDRVRRAPSTRSRRSGAPLPRWLVQPGGRPLRSGRRCLLVMTITPSAIPARARPEVSIVICNSYTWLSFAATVGVSIWHSLWDEFGARRPTIGSRSLPVGHSHAAPAGTLGRFADPVWMAGVCNRAHV